MMTLDLDVPAQDRPAEKRALLVGIGYHNDIDEDGQQSDSDPLPTSIPNIRKFEEYIRTDCGYTNVIVMTDEDGVKETLQPTRSNLEREMRALTHGIEPGDRLVFYYSGHSGQVPCKHGTEDDNMDEFLVALQGVKIKDNKLNKWLVDPLPLGSSLTAIFDSCNSGTLLDLRHYKCNTVYSPWVNKGQRRTNTPQNSVVRRDGMVLGPPRSSKGSSDPLPSLAQAAQAMEVDQIITVPEGIERRPEEWCPSPEPKFTQCEGKCRDPTILRKASLPHADVISISSSNDGQFSYDGFTSDGDIISMTSHLIKILREHRQITYHELVTRVSHEVHSFTVGMHKQERFDRRKARGKKTNSGGTEPREKGEMDNFQNLQLGSMAPLDMNRIFTL